MEKSMLSTRKAGARTGSSKQESPFGRRSSPASAATVGRRISAMPAQMSTRSTRGPARRCGPPKSINTQRRSSPARRRWLGRSSSCRSPPMRKRKPGPHLTAVARSEAAWSLWTPVGKDCVEDIHDRAGSQAGPGQCGWCSADGTFRGRDLVPVTYNFASQRLYVTTGDNYSDPTTQTSDAFLALNVGSGELAWTRQITSGDAFTVACPKGINCPKSNGPDFDSDRPPFSPVPRWRTHAGRRAKIRRGDRP